MDREARASIDRVAWLWLRELDAEALGNVRGLPPLSAAASQLEQEDLEELSAEHHRLLGFLVPPHESLFLDPSAMLLAPATARLERSYATAGFTPPADARAPAPDHLGLELLAWAHAYATGERAAAARLLHGHLALWLPPWVDALLEAQPVPLYRALAEHTVELVLSAVERGGFDAPDPLPHLPPPPVYRGTGLATPEGFESPPGGRWDQSPDAAGHAAPSAPDARASNGAAHEGGTCDERAARGATPGLAPSDAATLDGPSAGGAPPQGAAQGPGADEAQAAPEAPDGAGRPVDDRELGLRQLVRHLLRPREAGLWLGRADARQLGVGLGLPGGVGGREQMLSDLLRSAGAEARASQVLGGLQRRVERAASRHSAWRDDFPAWSPVADAWLKRLTLTQERLERWAQDARAAE